MKKTILYCEDDSLLAAMYKQKLEAAGFRVIIKPTVSESLQWLKTHPPSLVIVDIVLPKTNGIVLIKAIRMQYSREKVKILVHTDLSPVSTNFTSSTAQSLGVDTYLLKSSTTPGQLVAAVKHLIKL